MREFRLIFGGSTFATGAVLAIFMAGLGVGSARLGARADARARPLLFYGNLEIFIAVAAGLSPLLLAVAAKVYFASGGSPELGIGIASLLRLALATLVLGPATYLMGGTLPAAARAAETDEDSGRHVVALLYGSNTLGAVAGTLLSTFVMLETFGNRRTLIIAVLVNLLVGMMARSMGRSALVAGEPAADASGAGQEEPTPVPVYVASALVGFAFLLMELVWYRMLSPILGGTTYMFGLILAVALAGIGTGGALYALLRNARASAGAFAVTCSLEAFALAVPFALGDRLAVLANVLRPLGSAGFGGHVAAWTLVTAIVVFPAACVAGYQFPLLIALLGRGRENVGRQIGAAYAWNTAGAIAGSLAGGFGLLPLLSAPGTWRLAALLLAALAAAALVFAMRERELGRGLITIAVGVAAVGCALSAGPTAVWRHSGIGAARAPQAKTRNELEEWMHTTRRTVVWEKDGRESSVAAVAITDLSFLVNGKSDGSARRDAETQVMIGLTGAALHAGPKTSLVIGLGTGSTAGWLGRVPSMQRVDVVELEPVVLDIARECSKVNAGAMNNPRVKVTIADAREVLLTSGRTYDLIASEPSNPYRAGVASLFTREFYQAAEQRLAPGGYLMQWVQAYAMHPGTIRTIYATLTSVFPHVQTWWTAPGDFLLVASREPIVIDAGALRARLASEPFRSALHNVWRAGSAEQFLARMVANESYARAAAAEADELNTDDRTVIEFGFARSLDAPTSLLSGIAAEAEGLRANRPVSVRGAVDWRQVDANRVTHLEAAAEPLNLGQLSDRAVAMADSGDERATRYIDILARHEPIEAGVALAALRSRRGRDDEAAALLARALVAYRANPWPQFSTMQFALSLALRVGETSAARARVLHAALSEPFAVLAQENFRRAALIRLAGAFDRCGPATVNALRAVEPHPYWTRETLQLRARCYGSANPGPPAEIAARDLNRFLAASPQSVVPAPPR